MALLLAVEVDSLVCLGERRPADERVCRAHLVHVARLLRQVGVCALLQPSHQRDCAGHRVDCVEVQAVGRAADQREHQVRGRSLEPADRRDSSLGRTERLQQRQRVGSCSEQVALAGRTGCYAAG